MLNKAQKDALNNARREADEVRRAIENLKADDLMSGTHYGLAVSVTNIVHTLVLILKS